MKKICLIASSGGHYEQILMLKELKKKYNVYIITERTKYTKNTSSSYKLMQLNRKDPMVIPKLILVSLKSIYIFFKERPNAIISTGALCCVPTFIVGKIFGTKLIYIESYAKINSPTITGKLLYNFVDVFVVQWVNMLKFYPKAEFWGSIY